MSLTNLQKNELHLTRIKKFKECLPEFKVSHFLIENPTDIFYLTGLKLSLGKLLISHEHHYLVVDGRYFDDCKERSPIPVQLLESQKPYVFLEKEPITSFGFDADFTSYKTYETFKELIHFIKPLSHLVPINNPLEKIRKIKDEYEIALLKKAASISWNGYQHMLPLIREGVLEKELAFEYESFCKKAGADALSFDPIIAFGSNSAKPHYRNGEARFNGNEVILMDIGVKYKEYCSDMTRVVLPSSCPDWLLKIHSTVLDAYHAARSLCKPGVRLKELDEAARAVMRDAKLENHFLHSLGHGVGLDIHEYPRISKTGLHKEEILEPGMVITLEPGLYMSGKGGIRYEDTLIITASGHENLYPDEE